MPSDESTPGNNTNKDNAETTKSQAGKSISQIIKITGIVVGPIAGIIVAYIGYLGVVAQIDRPIYATQTAEVKAISTLHSSTPATDIGAATIVALTPTHTFILTDTPSPVAPSDTPTSAPSDAPSPTIPEIQFPGQDFQNGCISVAFWRHREEQDTPTTTDGCWVLSKYGITADNGLNINYAKSLTYWLSTPLFKPNVDIEFDVVVENIKAVQQADDPVFVAFGIGASGNNLFVNGNFLYYYRLYGQQYLTVRSGDSPSNAENLATYRSGTLHHVKMVVSDTLLKIEVIDQSSDLVYMDQAIITPDERQAFLIGYNIAPGSNSSISAKISNLHVIQK